MELHTFSSLNENFLKEYKGSMDEADEAVVYFNPHTIAHKKLKPISVEQVRECFGRNDIQVVTESSKVLEKLKNHSWKNQNLLMMTSGNFDGIDFNALAEELN
jgi:UDP-N-acetylmuramate: L-alanyl-gamma-D-glutamyl-meso-diaminopimelate ligase